MKDKRKPYVFVTLEGPDDFVVVTASVFDFSAVCSRGTGLLIDPSDGSIVNNKLFAEETKTLSKGV